MTVAHEPADERVSVDSLETLRCDFIAQWDRALHGSVDERSKAALSFDRLVSALALALPVEPEQTRRVAAAVFDHLAPAIEGSTFARRALHKPCGYCGDVLTMEAVYEGPRFERGGAPALLDACLTSLPPAHAVRGRLAYMGRHLDEVLDRRGAEARIVSIGCGAARELVEVFTKRPERPHLTLIDLDPIALATARERLEALGFGRSLDTVRANARTLARGALTAGTADLVYSMGLMDYFADDVVTRIIDWSWSALAEHGWLVIGNFQPTNPAKIVMEMFLDWPLHYRDALDLDRVFLRSSVGRRCDEIEREPSGVHLFAIQIKGSTVSCASDGSGTAANEAPSDRSPCPEGVAS